MLDVLGMACAELGRFDDAQKAAQEAINLAKASGMTNDAVVVQQRLRLYQNHQPWRESFCPPTHRQEPARKLTGISVLAVGTKSHTKNPMSRPRLMGLLLALVTLLAYLPASRDGFVNYDDQDYVTENSSCKKD